MDLVFFNREANQLRLVELKRGRLDEEHEAQLKRYLAHAYQSPLLHSLLEGGANLGGILATVSEGKYKPISVNITVKLINPDRVIAVLKRLRRQHLSDLDY